MEARWRATFGTRGSQVQILPLRPKISKQNIALGKPPSGGDPLGVPLRVQIDPCWCPIGAVAAKIFTTAIVATVINIGMMAEVVS
jgi:hypothetical protein